MAVCIRAQSRMSALEIDNDITLHFTRGLVTRSAMVLQKRESAFNDDRYSYEGLHPNISRRSPVW